MNALRFYFDGALKSGESRREFHFKCERHQDKEEENEEERERRWRSDLNDELECNL